ncbi:MAG TPA: glucose-6-phosphate dehydrogenase assembly protein OpcA [Acidimicrobiales bacterium]
MADAVAVDTWSGQGVRLSEVVAGLADLRHQSKDERSARTTVMTLVAVAPDDDRAYAATRALRSLGGRHPARIVMLRPDPDQVASLDARAALFTVENEGHETNFEEVTLTVCGQAAKHLDSLVDAFTVSDLPVALWYVGSVPDPTDPLLKVATALLVDSRDAADTGRFRPLLEVARRRTVSDLSWIRLRPWRELLSGLFDPPECRRWLQSVESVTVTGKVGPRKMLGGWLLAQLGLQPRQVTLQDARHVEIHVTCREGTDEATFEVTRANSVKAISAQAVLPDGPRPPAVHPLADDPLAVSLSEALTNLAPDVIWERALATATLLGE